VPEPEPDSWLNPDVEVRPSDVAGHGLFAVTDLPGGTRVSRLGGQRACGDHVYGDHVTESLDWSSPSRWGCVIVTSFSTSPEDR